MRRGRSYLLKVGGTTATAAVVVGALPVSAFGQDAPFPLPSAPPSSLAPVLVESEVYVPIDATIAQLITRLGNEAVEETTPAENMIESTLKPSDATQIPATPIQQPAEQPSFLPEPSAQPRSTREPHPTLVTPATETASTVAPEPAPTPQPTEESQPSSEPTAAPQPTAEPQPTAVPQPTAAPEPTVAPAPTSRSEPTVAPQPSRAPAPEPVPVQPTLAPTSQAESTQAPLAPLPQAPQPPAQANEESFGVFPRHESASSSAGNSREDISSTWGTVSRNQDSGGIPGAEEWVSDYLQHDTKRHPKAVASGSNIGVMGAENSEAQAGSAQTIGNIARGISLISGPGPLLIFTGCSAISIAVIVRKFIRTNNRP